MAALVSLLPSGWSVVNQYVRNWPINYDVTLQAFTSLFKGNRTFHFAICFLVTPRQTFADWCSGIRWPSCVIFSWPTVRSTWVLYTVNVFFFHNPKLGKIPMSYFSNGTSCCFLTTSLQRPFFRFHCLPTCHVYWTTVSVRVRPGAKRRSHLIRCLLVLYKPADFHEAHNGRYKTNNIQEIVRIHIYIYIDFFPSKKACTSSAVFRYPINRMLAIDGRSLFPKRQAEARAELKDFCPVTLVETGKLVKAHRGFTLEEVLYHCVKARKWMNCSKTQTILKDVCFQETDAGGCLTRFRCWFLADFEARRPRRFTW